MKYESIKHSFLIILIATTIVGCAGNSVVPASQYQTSSESFDSRGDTSSIDGDEGGWPTKMEYSMGAKIINTAAFIVLAPPLFALALIAGGVH